MELVELSQESHFWFYLRMTMKHQFLKSALVLGSVLAFINCSEEASNAAGSIDPNTIADNLLSSSTVLPTSATVAPDVPSSSAANGQTTISSPSVNPGLSSASVQPGTSSPNVPQGISSSSIAKANSSNSVKPASSAAQKPQSSSSQQQPKSSAATSNKQCDGQCYDNASGKCVGYHENLTGSKGEQYAYNESCKLNCYYDPNNKNCESMTGSTPASSQSQQQPKSSSSAVKSSSSTAKSSNSTPSSSSQPKSSSSQGNGNAAAEESQYLNAGAGGQQGFATRYWDCCMPHCAWPEHGGSAKTCDAKGKTPISNDRGSICSGGQGTTCTSQMPIIVSDKLAYAFAATPGNDNTCGKCFALTFTGTGKYETKENHQKLKGKTLVVMASNIGYDVQGGQFDIMIPGGGFGAFNGCSQMGWNIQTNTTYGGLLSDCENESGYDGDVYSKRKQCLTEKCNKSFPNDTEAKEGCLFLATWMEAAGNPNHTYKEVPCPEALKAKY